MKSLKLEIELTYDDEAMYVDDKEGREWFLNDVLMDPEGLTLFSNEIGDVVGDVKVVRIIEDEDKSKVKEPK